MRKIITYGTFDLFHEGHRRLLARARALGDYLIVGVTGDSFDRERGKLNVKDSLAVRIESVRATGYADEIIVEEYLGQKQSDIIRFGVDTFVIGSDWEGKYDYLAKYCEVIYLDRTKGVSSTELREEQTKLLRLGIVTDSMDDGDVCAESYFVSGLEVSGVYMPVKEGAEDLWRNNTAAAEMFRVKYDLENVFDTEEALISGSDIIYIHMMRRHRFEFAANALRAGRHVICDFPLNKPEQADEIYRLVEEKGVIFIECVPLAYLRTFRQLTGLLAGGAIGRALSVDCVMPANGNFRDAEALMAFVVTKILGADGVSIRRHSVRVGERFDRVVFFYEDAAASCAVSESEWLNPGMTVLGTAGRLDVPDAWWNMNYFKVLCEGEERARRYSFNIEGPGWRYLLSEVTQMIAENRTESIALSHSEAKRLVRLLEEGDLL